MKAGDNALSASVTHIAPERDASAAPHKSRVGDVIRVAGGNLLEMYDFMVFGYYAEAIGRTFFPPAALRRRCCRLWPLSARAS
jgi:hypothetical protein